MKINIEVSVENTTPIDEIKEIENLLKELNCLPTVKVNFAHRKMAGWVINVFLEGIALYKVENSHANSRCRCFPKILATFSRVFMVGLHLFGFSSLWYA